MQSIPWPPRSARPCPVAPRWSRGSTTRKKKRRRSSRRPATSSSVGESGEGPSNAALLPASRFQAAPGRREDRGRGLSTVGTARERMRNRSGGILRNPTVMFLLPMVLYLILWRALPLLYTVYLSLNDWNLIKPGGMRFIGLENY